jgi:hypothetical protein
LFFSLFTGANTSHADGEFLVLFVAFHAHVYYLSSY